MINLTDCSTYEEVVALIKEREWSSTQVASKCWHYHQNIALSKTDKTLKKRQEVYQWLCEYQKEFHTGNKPSEHKDRVVALLLGGHSPIQICNDLYLEGIVVARSTIYKYRREVNK